MSMAIAETEPRKSDADDTSTGGSKSNTLENEPKNMLTGQGTSQLSPVVHKYFENIKDFTFYMPGGWNDLTIRVFLDSCKTYLEDFRNSTKGPGDDLKLWSKIVKKCRENWSKIVKKCKSNHQSDFTVNSVLDLAKTLKAYVLSNENRKNDKAFKVLYDDVVELLQYFPSESSGNMSQNLHQRNTSESSHADSAPDVPETASVVPESNNIDHIVVKCCHDFQNLLESPKTSSKYVWTQLSQKIYENCGIRMDVKKHISDIKRSIIRETKRISDPKTKEIIFTELVGDYRFLFDFIPPLNVRVEDFIMKKSSNHDPISEDASEENNLNSSKGKTDEPGQRKGRKSSKSNQDFSCEYKTPSEDQAEPVTPVRRVGRREKTGAVTDENGQGRALRSRHQSRSSESKRNPIKQEPLNDDFDDDIKPNKRKRGRPRRSAAPPKKPVRGKYSVPDENDFDSDSDGSSGDNMYSGHKAAGYAARRNVQSPANSGFGSEQHRRKNFPQPVNGVSSNRALPFSRHPNNQNGFTNPVGSGYPVDQNQPTDEINISGGNVSLTQQNMIVPSLHRDQPLAPKTVETKMCIAKPVQPNTSGEIPSHSIAVINQMSSANQPATEPNPSRSNVAPVRPEPSPYHSSQSPNDLNMPSTSREGDINQRVHDGVGMLHRLDASTVRLIEGYKEKVMESNTPATMMQLIPVSQVAGYSGVQQDNSLTPVLNNSRPPSWFDTFVCDYKKHEMWKMHQLLKMQQELVDMENRKLSVLEKILGSLNDK